MSWTYGTNYCAIDELNRFVNAVLLYKTFLHGIADNCTIKHSDVCYACIYVNFGLLFERIKYMYTVLMVQKHYWKSL